jgi:hypothetical protein
MPDDYAGSTATTGVVSVGGSITGNIESTGDQDWFRVTLTAGRSYQFDLEASATGQGTLPNPFLRLIDSAGNFIASDSDAGIGNNAQITFAPSASGTYYLAADATFSSDLGTYRLSAADITPGPNRPPTITSNGGGGTATVSIAENSMAVTTVTATDPDAGTTLSYTIVGGTDAGKFAINPSTGALSFLAAPDFENAADADHNNSYIVQVRASDGSLFDDQTVTVSLTNVNEVPTITSNAGSDSATVSIFENTTSVSTVAATDPDAGTTLAYSIAGGVDAGKFQINATTGALSFLAAPDYENPADADHNNSYIVQVRASDGSLFDDQLITINVANVVPPVDDFNGDGKSDLAWRNDDGHAYLWEMTGNGAQRTDVDLGFVSNAWHIQETDDFNGDGKNDIAWRNDDGHVYLWEMTGNGAQYAGVDLGIVANSWHLS